VHRLLLYPVHVGRHGIPAISEMVGPMLMTWVKWRRRLGEVIGRRGFMPLG